MSVDAIISLEETRWAAMMAGDIAVLTSLLDDELTWTHANGHLDDKSGFLAKLSGGNVRYVEVRRSDERVRVRGTAAVVTGLARMEVLFAGEQKSLANRFTDVWVCRDDTWRLFAWQSTPVPAT